MNHNEIVILDAELYLLTFVYLLSYPCIRQLYNSFIFCWLFCLGGWWRWALVSPDGVAPSWMVNVSACVNLPCTIKSRSSLLALAHPGGPGKRAVKRLWWCWLFCWVHLLISSKYQIFSRASVHCCDFCQWTMDLIQSGMSRVSLTSWIQKLLWCALSFKMKMCLVNRTSLARQPFL